MTFTRYRARRPVAAFTLVEVLLALAVAGLVSVSALMMLHALGTAANERYTSRDAQVKQQLATLRIGSLLRGSAMVLATSSNAAVLWTGDVKTNGVPDLSELRLVRFDSTTHELWSYESPETLPVSSNSTYALTDDFMAITSAFAGSPIFSGSLVLTNTSAWSMSLDNASTQAARLIRVRITTQSASGDGETTIVAALKCQTP